jgi:hypothetical protein
MPKRVCVWYGEKDEENSHSHAPLKELKTETLLVFTVKFWSRRSRFSEAALAIFRCII